jgi:hypothetical protein
MTPRRLLALVAAAVAALAVLDILRAWRQPLPPAEPWTESDDGVQVDVGLLR